MMQTMNTHDASQLAEQCREALTHVTFHDLATRKLFETLINRVDSFGINETAHALGEQKIL